MRKINLFRRLALFTSFALLLYSCQREMQHLAQQKEPVPKVNPHIPQSLLEKVKAQGRSYTVAVNQAGKGFIADANGNPYQGKPTSPNSRLATDPAYCDDPVSAPPDDATLTSIDVIYTCGSGYQLNVKWRISSVFGLVTANPLNSSQLSRGRIRLRDGNGSTVFTITSLTPLTISNMGTDPTDSEKTIFEVKYTASVSTSNMNGSATIDNSYLIYTDCGSSITVSIPYLSIHSFLTNSVTTPCVRVDNVQVIPVSPAPGYSGYVSGSDPAFSCSDTYVHNTTSYIEHRLQGTAQWYPLKMYEAGNPTVRTSGHVYYCEVLYIKTADLQAGPGIYEFRWRNTYGNPNTSGLFNANKLVDNDRYAAS